MSRLALVCTLISALLAMPLSPSKADTASDIASLKAAVAALQTQNASLQRQVNTLKSITRGFSRVTDTTRTDGRQGTELYLTGFNLHVVNGMGATDTQNGLGNIVVGYNGLRTGAGDLNIRTGSHTLIVGDGQNYSSFGGVMFGKDNNLSAPYASVSGGYNTASGELSCISGGEYNFAKKLASSVSGGEANTASGDGASVSGGTGNIANGPYASVSGGRSNTANDFESSVSGGANNVANDFESSVSGGVDNTAIGTASSISGGQGNTAVGNLSSVSGGLYLLENNTYGFAAGGTYTQASPGPGVFHNP